MLLILPVLLGIALALIRGGSLQHLATWRIRGAWAIIASFAIQAIMYVPAVRDTALAHQYGQTLYIGVMALMVFGVASNWHLGIWARVVLFGLALNTLVVVANGGHMPVNATTLRAEEGPALVRIIGEHQEFANRMLADRHSLLLPLSDIIPVSLPFGRGTVASLGDIFIAAGAAALAYGGTRRPYRLVPPAPIPATLLAPGAPRFAR